MVLGVRPAPPVWVATNDGDDMFAVTDYELDCAYGTGDDPENDFELKFARDSSGGARVLSGGELWYIEGTAWGGIVDQVKAESNDDTVTYSGRAWAGAMANKVVLPPSGGGNVVESGDANAVVRDLIGRCDLAGCIEGATADAGITVASYSVARFADLWTALTSALASANARPRIRRYQGGPTVVDAVPALEVEAFGDSSDLTVTRAHRVTNHLVCAGEGEQGERARVDLYADAAGNVSTSQTFRGADEIAELYDFTSADVDQMTKSGTERLQSYQKQGEASLEMDGEALHVGDRARALEPKTGTAAAVTVDKAILKVQGGVYSVENGFAKTEQLGVPRDQQSGGNTYVSTYNTYTTEAEPIPTSLIDELD